MRARVAFNAIVAIGMFVMAMIYIAEFATHLAGKMEIGMALAFLYLTWDALKDIRAEVKSTKKKPNGY